MEKQYQHIKVIEEAAEGRPAVVQAKLTAELPDAQRDALAYAESNGSVTFRHDGSETPVAAGDTLEAFQGAVNRSWAQTREKRVNSLPSAGWHGH